METDLQQRLVGAIVLIILAIVFIPLILSDRPVTELIEERDSTELPVLKEEFNSSVTPVTPETGIVVEEDISLEQSAELSETAEQQLDEVSPVESPSVAASNIEPQDNPPPKQAVIEQSQQDPPDVIPPTSETIPTQAEIKTTLGATQAWVVQLASFNSEDNANKLNQRLLDKNFESFIEPLTNQENNTVIYRVRVGPPLLDKSRVEAIREQLKQSENLEGIVIEYP